ncbi:MAG: hypothetical protein HYZ08_02495 [Candidatus Kerfeldbacteria bacterium]|nr:hypothetical protein [Candidatus Kerfeldbacteria bacterium]
MTTVIRFMIAEGVPIQTVIFILMLPVIATLIALVRQIIGLKGFGLYTPLIVAFAFVATGLRYGILIFLAVLLFGTAMRVIVKQFRLLYLPRMAIVISVVSLAILFMFAEGAYSGRTGFIASSIFPVLIIITLVENFVAAQIEQGTRSAFLLTLETLALAITSFFVITWEWAQDLVLQYPWIIFVMLGVNILLGRYTGLRFTEYVRFREVIKHAELPQKK